MTQSSKTKLIFVNRKHYRVLSDVSPFQNEDFIRGFNPDYHLTVARLLEPGLGSEESNPASLGIRTLHGLAVEAFFALLFSILQAPDAPAAWFLLYKPGAIEELLLDIENERHFPSRAELSEISWTGIAKAILPLTDPPNAEEIIANFSDFWARLATDFRTDLAKKEFNALKHGLRARAASPLLSIGGHIIPAAEHGSSFPVPNRQGDAVILNIGFRSWSAKSLLAELELISASLTNLLAILKQIHGIEEFLEFVIPDEIELHAARPPKSQALSSFAVTTHWPEGRKIIPLGKEEALELYLGLGTLTVTKR